MKEHALYVAVSFPPKNEDFIREGAELNSQFNNLLRKHWGARFGVIVVENDATEFTLRRKKDRVSHGRAD